MHQLDDAERGKGGGAEASRSGALGGCIASAEIMFF
jgi:hypothetical protein